MKRRLVLVALVVAAGVGVAACGANPNATLPRHPTFGQVEQFCRTQAKTTSTNPDVRLYDACMSAWTRSQR